MNARESAAELNRMIAAACDSPGVWIKRGNFTVYASKARLSDKASAALNRLNEASE